MKKLLLSAGLLASLLALCSGTKCAEEVPNGIWIKLSKNEVSNQLFTVNTGDYLLVKIPENPTTGFRLTTPMYPKDIFELKETFYIKQNMVQKPNKQTKEPMTGGGGHRIFIFKALKPSNGPVAITTTNASPWEPATKGTDYVIQVGVTPARPEVLRVTKYSQA